MAGSSRRLLAPSKRRGFATNGGGRRKQVKCEWALLYTCKHRTKSSPFYRATFLSFCNHSESRCIFVHTTTAEGRDGELIQVSSSPPPHLSNKAIVFLKCSHASKLSRENLAQDVIYTGKCVCVCVSQSYATAYII